MTADRLARLMNYGSREVFVLDTVSGKERIFPTATSVYSELDLSKKAVTTILSKNTLRKLSGYVFTYADNDDSILEIKRAYGRPGR